MEYRSSRSPLTKKQKLYLELNNHIVAVMNTLTEAMDAESLWLEIIKRGHKMSISSFYGHLKKLAEAGSIIKIHVVNNKFAYKTAN